MSTSIFIRTPNPRPEFGLVITFLWGQFHNVDSDGDSTYPTSLEWTELYVQNREIEDETFDVSLSRNEPLTLVVKSDSPELAARVAYFLALQTNGTVSTNGNDYLPPRSLVAELGVAFSLDAAMNRVQRSRR